jgi:hypothetical protein
VDTEERMRIVAAKWEEYENDGIVNFSIPAKPITREREKKLYISLIVY